MRTWNVTDSNGKFAACTYFHCVSKSYIHLNPNCQVQFTRQQSHAVEKKCNIYNTHYTTLNTARMSMKLRLASVMKSNYVEAISFIHFRNIDWCTLSPHSSWCIPLLCFALFMIIIMLCFKCIDVYSGNWPIHARTGNSQATLFSEFICIENSTSFKFLVRLRLDYDCVAWLITASPIVWS